MPLFSFFGSSSSSSPAQKMTYPDQRSEDEWRMVLNKEQFRILREKGTEPAGSGEYDKHYPEQGTLPGAVERHEDRAFGIVRTEIVCSNCGGHLGHVFKGEGFSTPTDERHCVNSVSIKFSPEDPVVSKDSAEKKA
ncbi:unnamed protein product [Parascedosporium putredinis]|uniref:MsrB domain-containing protein n=1 Tax=Parascedosporium putredinis TaxID=1442378 RepID=A0A9P1HB45_9PEZI|nr:unnamed protein product [Parascedosporium putredinis]CAI8004623.1 unnamed protein product [Parascedosporium putredinis]